jgi:hypothetical protein
MRTHNSFIVLGAVLAIALSAASASAESHACQALLSHTAAAAKDDVEKLKTCVAEASAERKAKIAKFSFEGPKFETLVKAAAKFRDTRAENEIDPPGTALSARVLREQNAQDQDFFESLETFSQNQVPRLDFKKENIELNKSFKKILTAKNTSAWGGLTKDTINKTQKAWVEYRNAWRAFAGSEKADQVDAWLTQKRTQMLKSILGER